jgi:hypothetical protein
MNISSVQDFIAIIKFSEDLEMPAVFKLINYPPLTETEDSLRCLQEASIGFCPEPDESTSTPSNIV